MHLVKRAQKFGLLPPLFGQGPKVNILFSCSDSAVLNNFPCQVSKVRLKNYPHDQVVLFQPLFLNLILKIHIKYFRSHRVFFKNLIWIFPGRTVERWRGRPWGIKLLVECSVKRTWRGNKIVKYILLLFCVEEWLTKIWDTYSISFKQREVSISQFVSPTVHVLHSCKRRKN